MRFEELAYTVDGLPVTVAFDARLTVVPVAVEDGPAWVARLIGVLGGFRHGDGASLVCADSAGRRIRLERDDQGAATLTDLDSGEEVPYSAAHLSLDGRFDWFASIGISAGNAAGLMVVDRAVFADQGPLDPGGVEAELRETRRRLARAARQHQAAMGRRRHVDGLRRRLAELDERRQAEAEAVLTPPELERLTDACRAAARHRDELVTRLDPAGPAGPHDAVLRQLTAEAEPALVDALAALAAACRRFGVVLDADRLGVAGVTSAGIATVCAELLSEVSTRAAESAAAPAPIVDVGESECRTAEGRPDLHQERSRLAEELERCLWDLPDVEHLAERRSAVERQVAALEASLGSGRRQPTVDEVEAILVAQALAVGRVGRHREPLPLVVDAALGPTRFADRRSLLDVVTRLAATTQVVYLSDDPETLARRAQIATVA